MHPYIYQEFEKIKMADERAYVARQRRLREAVSNRPRSIDFSNLGQKIRARLFGGSTWGGGKPAGAGA